MKTLREIGEFGLIERLERLLPTGQAVIEGIGDDCAIIKVADRQLLATCDMSIEGVHFYKDNTEPADIGAKAAGSGLSDIAAMGGAPLFCLVSLACAPETEVVFIEEMFKGMASLLTRFGVVIVGGDTTRTPERMVIDVTMLGEVTGHRCLRRKGAHEGDCLAITGSLGLAAAGLDALESGTEAPELIHAFYHPNPRISEGQWLSACHDAHAMIDISDGLVQDAGHLATASRMGVDIFSERLPVDSVLLEYCASRGLDARRLMLTGGEDYELAFALDAERADEIQEKLHREFRTPLTVVGRFTADWEGVRVDGQPPGYGGFDHFRQAPNKTRPPR